VLAYLRGGSDHKREIGHSPLAAFSVLALLGFMLLQVTMGLFAGDPFDGATGPLNSLVGTAAADTITETHEAFVYAIFAMIALHLGAIAYYSAVRAQNLIGAMVGGKAEKELDVEGNSGGSVGALLFSIAVALGITYWVWSGAPPLT
jgi:cytochrome b